MIFRLTVLTQTDYTCGAGRVKCPGGLQCILSTNMCDGFQNDCPDGSDENEASCRGSSVLLTTKTILI